MSLQCEFCGEKINYILKNEMQEGAETFLGSLKLVAYPAPSEKALQLGTGHSYCCQVCAPNMEEIMKQMILARGAEYLQESKNRADEIEKKYQENLEEEKKKNDRISDLMEFVRNTPFEEFTEEDIRTIKLKYPYTYIATSLLENVVEEIKRPL